MTSIDDFWKDMYKDDAIGYENHLKRQAETYMQMELNEQAERSEVSQLFSAKTSADVKKHINGLSESELLTYRRHLIRLNRDIESRYHRLMDEVVFSKSKVTLNEMVSRNSWVEVKKSLLQDFTKQENVIDGYEYVFSELKRLEPISNENNLVISMDYHEEEEGYSISGLKPKDIEKYALDFSPWEEWLGYYVSQKDLTEHSEVKIIAHCLWEMTFDGFTQEEIKKSLEEITSRVDDFEKNIDEKKE